MNDTQAVAALLRAIEGGDADARGELFEVLYTELNARADRVSRKQPRHVALRATALVQEAYLRLADRPDAEFEDGDHFIGCASRAMRGVLIDHVRRRHRGSDDTWLLDEVVDAFEERAIDIAQLDAALKELELSDPIMARAVELRYFGGASEAEVARIVGLSESTLRWRWAATKAWLRKRCDAR